MRLSPLAPRPSLVVCMMFCCFASNFTIAQNLTIGCGTVDGISDVGNVQLASTCSPNRSYADDFHDRHLDNLIPSDASGNLILRTNLIIVQNNAGGGNFDYYGNPTHREFLDDVFTRVNERMINLSPDCTTPDSPIGYSSLKIQFEPNVVVLKDNFYYNHRNDPQNNTFNVRDKPFLDGIVALAESHPDYEVGFNFITTTDKFLDDNWDRSQEIGRDPVWDAAGGQSYYSNGNGGVWYSGYPVFNNSVTPMFHAPDFYLGYQHQLLTDRGQEPDGREQIIEYFSGLIIHEYGHYFGLYHDSAGCTNNYMTPGGLSTSSAYSQFAAWQIRELYESLMFKNLGKVIKCVEDGLDDSFVVDTDESWTVNTRMPRDITVKAGAKLEITCTLEMQTGTTIFVERGGELHVNGGTITNCGSEYWKGIRVEGFSDFSSHDQSEAGLVRLDNRAVLEGAQEIISMWNGHLPWPAPRERYGGLVIAENATFQNSFRAVEFMRYASFGHLDQSSFTNCRFRNLEIGVSNWASDGVTFDNCSFININRQALSAYNSGINVKNGCVFSQTPVGVDVVTTSPVLPATVSIGSTADEVRNSFFCDDYGIRLESRTSAPTSETKIFGNSFNAGSIGILAQDENTLTVSHNIFNNSFVGLSTLSSRFEVININRNIFRRGLVGGQNEGQNLQALYTLNCFDDNGTDAIRVPIASSINPIQGVAVVDGFGSPVDNIFLKNPFVSSYNALDNHPANGTVTYYTRTSDQTSRYYPFRSVNTTVVTTAESLEDFDACLDLNPVFGGNILEEEDDRCDHMESLPEPPLPQESCLECMCVRRNELEGAKDGLANGSSVELVAQNLLNNDEFSIKIFGYGVYLADGDYDKARQSLATLTPNGAEEEDFVWAQEVYVNHLETSLKALESAAEENTLKKLSKIGLSGQRYSGYARSIYQGMTGERLVIEPLPVELGIDRTENLAERKDNVLSIHPNPTSGVFYVDTKGKFREGVVHIDVYNVTGELVATVTSLDVNRRAIDLSSLQNGVYFVRVRSELEESEIVKFIKQ